VAKQNDGDGFLNLGYMYGNGLGVEKDASKAFELYMRAAKLGVVNAMLNVALDYANGRGVEEDLDKANQWYLKAAEAGNERAMFNLGCNYEYGHGVAKNWDKAQKWYEKAAEKGNKDAEFRMKFSHLILKECESPVKDDAVVVFRRISGTVLDHKRNSETHVSSYGGGGYVGRYGGHVAAAQVESHVTTTDDFWVEDEYGNETHVSFINRDIILRAGQKVTIISMFFGEESDGEYKLLVNHSDGNVHRFKSISLDKKVEGMLEPAGIRKLNPIVAALFAGCIFVLFEFQLQQILFPIVLVGMLTALVWMLALRSNFSESKRTVSSRIISHLTSIEAWVKSSG